MHLNNHFVSMNMAAAVSVLMCLCISTMHGAPVKEKTFTLTPQQLPIDSAELSSKVASDIKPLKEDIDVAAGLDHTNVPAKEALEVTSQLAFKVEYHEKSNEHSLSMVVTADFLLGEDDSQTNVDNSEDELSLNGSPDEMNVDEIENLAAENDGVLSDEEDSNSEEDVEIDDDSLDCAITMPEEDMMPGKDAISDYVFIQLSMKTSKSTPSSTNASNVFVTSKCTTILGTWSTKPLKNALKLSDASKRPTDATFSPSPVQTAEMKEKSSVPSKDDQYQPVLHSSASDAQLAFVELPVQANSKDQQQVHGTDLNDKLAPPQVEYLVEHANNEQQTPDETLETPTATVSHEDRKDNEPVLFFDFEVTKTKYTVNPLYIFPLLIVSLIAALIFGSLRNKYRGKPDNGGSILKVPRMGVFSDFPNISALTPDMRAKLEAPKNKSNILVV